jgi:heme exporter protein A
VQPSATQNRALLPFFGGGASEGGAGGGGPSRPGRAGGENVGGLKRGGGGGGEDVTAKERECTICARVETPATRAVEASGLCRRYGRRWALAEVSFEVAPGRALMIAGRNGSGKSTLLRLLATAIRPDRGSARVAGHDVREERDAVRRSTALLSHHSYHYESFTALENLQVAARFLGTRPGREALLPLLEEVALADRADDAVQTFSAGMRKRLALARTLLQEASVVLLDEPYGELDPPGFRLVDRLFGVLKKRGASILMATHLLDRGAALCDDGLVLEKGRLAWSGSAADLPGQGGLDPATLPEASA